jgi:predicted aspartyl protease
MSGERPYPYLEFTLSIGTWDLIDDAYPDTGFDGGLIIPAGVGREILSSPAVIPLVLADGEIVQVRAWDGTLDINEHRFPVQVAALGSSYLLGREILDQVEICFQFGRHVRLRFADEAA